LRHSNSFNREGFFYSDHEPGLPTVNHSNEEWFGRIEFLNALAKVEYSTSPLRFKGSSLCRCCGKVNGSTEFVYNGWRWPSGLQHYIREHNYRPSLAFQEMILNKRLGEIDGLR
jgi:hypothetical protein